MSIDSVSEMRHIHLTSRKMRLFTLLFCIPIFAAAAPASSRLLRINPGFQENAGLAAADVLFSARDHRGTLEVTKSGVRFVLFGARRDGTSTSEVVPLDFPGASWRSVEPEQPLAAQIHHFIGQDKSAWKTGLRTYNAVRIRGAFPGIDIVFHTRRGSAEFDFELQPGADPKLARLHFPLHTPKLRPNGDLFVATAAGELLLPKPFALQDGTGKIPARFVRAGRNGVKIHVDRYDAARPLIIDPAISYLSYLGGAGTETAAAFAVDGAGNMYVAGSTASSNFPLGRNPVQNTLRGTLDAFVSKFAPDGTLVYSTLLGGGGTDAFNGIAVDTQGSVYFCGGSDSDNFPLSNALQSSNRGILDVVFGKLNPAGAALVYSSLYGGQFSDNALACVIDSENNLYLTGRTFSDNFPFTPGAFQTTNRSPFANTGFVTKINPTGTAAVFSTFLGGGGDERFYDIALDRNNNIVVVGSSEAILNPPYPTLGAFQPARRSAIDGVVTKLNAAGSGLLWSTYLGGPQSDVAFTVSVDVEENVYVAGITGGTGFPVSANALRREVTGPVDTFVVKLSASGTEMVYGTLFGGNQSEEPFQSAVDRSGAFYVTGSTSSTGLTAVDAVQPNFGGGSRDAYVAKFSPSGDAIQMMTYLGGSGEDTALNMALDNSGRVYVAGTSTSTNLATTSNGNQKAIGGGTDSFIAVIDSSTAANPFTLSTTRLTFTGAPGAAIAAQQFQIRAAAGLPTWTIDAATLSGGQWLSATPRTGTGSATIDVRVTTTGMTPGNYEGTLTVNNTRLGTRTVVAVLLTVGEAGGAVPDNGVVSAATFSGGAVSPGLLVTVFGSRIGPPTLTTAQLTA
ncbi:MAG: hypothetical protein FJW30_24135, partial [Acidobacteria bacterium]|nr:hypothetical protein [Acidobacteriota bacterium]